MKMDLARKKPTREKQMEKVEMERAACIEWP